jgi:hypothetical protein
MNNSRLFIDLEKHIDLTEWDNLKPEICRGIATAKDLAWDGIHSTLGEIRPHAQGIMVNPLWEVVKQWKELPEEDAFKVAGKGLNHNQLTDYLKNAFGAYDFYRVYPVIDEGNILGECSKHFPGLLKWMDVLIKSNVFFNIYQVNLITLDSGGIPWEHADLNSQDAPEPEAPDLMKEFIHIKTDCDRPFYIIDPATGEHVFMNTRAAWWNETVWHGGLPIQRPTYTLRINGRFTDEFRTKIGASNIV